MRSDEREERLELLFRSTFRRVLAYCLRRTDEAAAHDAVAEVYAVAWRRRRRLPPDDEAAALWLLGVARKVLANQARGQRRWARLAQRAAERAGPPPAPAPHEDVHDVRVALAGLPAADQELLRLAYWDDLSQREIAAVLGISAGAVSTRLHRARERLRPRLVTADPPETTRAKVEHHAER